MKKKISLFKIALFLLSAMILLIAGMLLFMKPENKHKFHKIAPADTVSAEPSPVFRKDGELIFRRAGSGREIVTINVEVADEEAERIQGLMYRDSMQVNNGMLFLFPAEEPMSFWMKNTRFSLDIIYVDANRKIVSIAPNTTPYSLDQIPSDWPAQYVVEVNAGFSAKYGLKPGDIIDY